MLSDVHRTRRNLPHWTRTEATTTYWVTFRLADSIPQTKLRTYRKEREAWLAAHPEPWDEPTTEAYQKHFPERIEAWLDAGYGSRALAIPEVRDVVVQCLTRFENERLDLPAAVIMPTHVHALVTPLADYTLAKLLKGIKGASARVANQLLGRTEKFWLDESYDHIVRDQTEFSAFVRYIAKNPVLAGLREDEHWLRLPT